MSSSLTAGGPVESTDKVVVLMHANKLKIMS